MSQKTNCPVCNSTSILTLYRTMVPVLQNRVYKDRQEAIASKTGELVMAYCQSCKFVFNAGFDETIIVYDENYENSVPSKLFHDYYADIATYLYHKYQLEGEVVYDIGCGKGTFLNVLCEKFPNVKGIGVDPSYEGELNPIENLHFIKDFFHESQITVTPKLVLSRHVFEHIEYPASFLDIIRNALKAFKDVPFFIEVPDFEWIVKNNTFWDLCYEHCNYYSNAPLVKLFSGPQIKLDSITRAFGTQYLWVEGLLNTSTTDTGNNLNLPEISLEEINGFIGSIQDLKKNIQDSISDYKSKQYKIVVWGMATKGVIFSNIIDPSRSNIDYCIDINKEKQYKFSPVTGHQLLPPSELTTETKSKLLIIVMNTNYLQEIRNEALALCPTCTFIDAHGNVL